jgi:hypothetical protein
VEERELEVVVARVAGVQEVLGTRLFARETVGGELRWRRLQALREGAQAALRLDLWQLPELLAVVVAAGEVPSTVSGSDGTGGSGTGGTGTGSGTGTGTGTGGSGTGTGSGDEIPIPVVPEVC